MPSELARCPRPRQPLGEVDDEDFGLVLSNQGQAATPCDTGSITRGKQDIVKEQLSSHHVQPDAAPGHQVVNDALPASEQG